MLRGLPARLVLATLAFAAPVAHAAQDTLPNRALFAAIARGEIEGVSSAIAAGADINAPFDVEATITPLAAAIVFESRPIWQLLLERGAAPRAHEDAAFLWAMLYCNPQATSDLIRAVGEPLPADSPLLLVLTRRVSRAIAPVLRDGLRAELLGAAVQSVGPPLEALAHPDLATGPGDPAILVASALLAAGVDVNRPDATESALSSAVDFGDVFVARFLAARGARWTRGVDIDVELLVAAAAAGNVAGLEQLLTQGVPVQRRDSRGRLALPALLEGDFFIVSNAIGTGDTLTLAAATNRLWVLARRLLDNGADPNDSGTDQHSPLVLAARRDSASVITELIARGARVNDVDTTGDWPLRSAVRRGRADLVDLLLAARASATTIAANGATALHDMSYSDDAIEHGSGRTRSLNSSHAEAARRLVSAGFNCRAEDDRERTALSSLITAENVQYDFLAALIAAGCQVDSQTLFEAVELRDHRALAWLLEHGGNVGATHGSGRSLLNAASDAIALNPELLTSLLRAGAMPATSEVNTILARAAGTGSVELVTLLLRAGADPNASAWVSRPIEAALRSGKADNVRALVAGGARLDDRDASGRTILHRLLDDDAAVGSGEPALITSELESAITALIECGFELSIRDAQGRSIRDAAGLSADTAARLARAVGAAGAARATPLHAAVRADRLDEVRRLIANGSDTSAVDAMHRTALTLALQLERHAIAHELLRQGAAMSLTPSAPWLRADIEYVSEPRLIAAFERRLLTTRLLLLDPNNARDDPSTSLNAFAANNSVRLPDVEWRTSCRPCTGERTFRGTETDQALGIRALRVDEPHGAWYRLISPPVPQVLHLVGELTFTVQGSLTIPACDFDFLRNPTCSPGVSIENTDEPIDLSLIVQQGPAITLPHVRLLITQGDSTKSLAPGERAVVDRSAGPIRVQVLPVESKSFSLEFRVRFIDGPDAAVAGGRGSFGDPVRMQMYARVATLRDQLDRALLESSGSDQQVRVKTLTATIHAISAGAVQQQYPELTRVRLQSRKNDLLALNELSTDIQHLVTRSSELTRDQVEALIAGLEALLPKVGGRERQALEQIRQELLAAREAAGSTASAVTILRDRFHTWVEEVIFDYQALVLELAQYVLPADLERRSGVTPDERRLITRRIPPSDSIVFDSALGGQGASIREVFGLPRPSP